MLGLQAFVQMSAYDVPPWLPGVLTALTSAAVEPAPVRTTVRSLILSGCAGQRCSCVLGCLQETLKSLRLRQGS